MQAVNFTVEDLRQWLDYDPATGHFVWKSRPPGKVNRIKIGHRAGWDEPNGYRKLGVRGQKFWEHRLAYFWMAGVWPEKFIDHVDGNGRNNSWNNLRPCTHSENLRNIGKKRNNTSGHKGVNWHPTMKKWVARINTDFGVFVVGYYEQAHQAGEAYKRWAEKFHGSFAKT